jgi:hypothetical protein
MAIYMGVAFALLVLAPVLYGFGQRPEKLVPEVTRTRGGVRDAVALDGLAA